MIVMKSKWILITVMILSMAMVVSLGLVGCKTTKTTTTAPETTAATTTAAAETTTTTVATTKNKNQYEGVTIRVIGSNDPYREYLVSKLPEFTKKTGIKVNFELYSVNQMVDKILVEVTSKSSSLDVISYRPLMDLSLYTKNGWLEPLDSYITADNFDIEDFEPLIDISKANGKTYGIPCYVDNEILWYRKDIFEKNNLKPPKTLDEMMQIAKKLNDPKNNFFGFVTRGMKNDACTTFSGFLFSFGGDFQKDHTATINTPEAVAAYKYYTDILRNYGPLGVENYSYPQAVALFAQGNAAMYIDASALNNSLVDPKNSKVTGLVGHAVFPAGPAGSKPYSTATWSMGISSFSKNKDASWEFLKWAYSKEMVTDLQANVDEQCRKSVWEDPNSFGKRDQEYVDTLVTTMKIGVNKSVPITVSGGKAREIVTGDPIIVGLKGGDIQAACDKANTELQQLFDADLGK